jgi:chemotaxis protein MotB
MMAACVPARQFEDLKAKEKQCEDDNSKIRSDNASLNTQVSEQLASINDLHKQVRDLISDTTRRGSEMRRLQDVNDELQKSYDKLIANNDKMLAGNTEETKKLIAELNKTQEDLQKKEDQLKKDENDLDNKQKNLADREAKVAELQSILARKDSVVSALKKTVSDALLGFADKGLTVEQRNGKVYVSLEDRLLFATGSTVVDKKGEEALKQLAAVLEKNPDINILVEGHTDDVPITGVLPSGAKDNWDLSVLRATSVVKIITKDSSIDPRRLTAAGRGPYVPIDPGKTEEARKRNRRTEIILSPKLDELLKVLETN